MLLAGLAALCLLPLFAGRAAADQLDKVRASGVLRWGGDAEGGAPFIFKNEKGEDVGFEVELADMLAKEMGLKPYFQQGNWDTVPGMLGNDNIDIALNGYERTEARLREYDCTRPYYTYGLQLMSPRNGTLVGWEQLEPPVGEGVGRPTGKQLRIGVLKGSSAHLLLLSPKYNHSVAAVSYDVATQALEQADKGLLDGTLQDDCIAVYYASRYTNLRFLGRPIAPGYYVGLVRKGEIRLLDAVNQALHNIIKDGRLQKLYDRWDMSGKFQALSLQDVTESKAAPKPTLGELLYYYTWPMLQAAGMTVMLSFIAMPLAIMIGVTIAVGRLYGPGWLGRILALYVEVIRGTPLMLQLYTLFFVLPSLGIALHPMVAAIAGLAINYSAYESEIYRAGIQAIPRGQMEAALALGMSKSQAIWKIILPQAMRLVIPPVTNDFVALFKDTSVCSVVTIVELTKQYNMLANSTGATIQMAIMAGLLYLAMSYPLSLFARASEKRLSTDA